MVSMKIFPLYLLFLFGLAIRVVLIFLTEPVSVVSWYVPFLEASAYGLSFDPWSTWLGAGRDPVAFPYGYSMWLVFLPLSLLSKLVGVPLIYGYFTTLLTVDILFLFVLRQFFPGRDRLMLFAYWLSPIVIISSYGLGYNDLVPALLLTVSLNYTRKIQLIKAAIFCMAAISAKLSMVLALPFFLIYLLNNRTKRQELRKFMIGLSFGAAVLILPFLASDSAMYMLFNNPEVAKVFSLALRLEENLFVYAVPLTYLVVLYMIWQVHRLNYDLFIATMGIAFLLIILMTPASPGWFIWAMPFLIFYQVVSDRVTLALTSIFAGLYLLSSLLVIPIKFVSMPLFNIVGVFHESEQFTIHVASLFHTGMVVTGIILGMRLWRETVKSNDYFRFSRTPFVIGIAGDSGAGKNIYSDVIEGLFGKPSVTTLSGDDYHFWDRQKPMWQVMTHLNPMANDLERFGNDLVALIEGKSIQSHRYDHGSGKKGKPVRVKSNDIILVSGLHALYSSTLRNCYNLTVYLDMDEGLRRHYKMDRDVNKRGHSVEVVLESLEKRERDSALFVRSQCKHADLILSLQPIHPRMLENDEDKDSLRLKLVVVSRQGLSERSIIRVLVGVCGLYVAMDVNDDGSEVTLTLEGDPSADDIAMAAKILCPRILEFLDIQPKWEYGINGLMQLITLAHINFILTNRIS